MTWITRLKARIKLLLCVPIILILTEFKPDAEDYYDWWGEWRTLFQRGEFN